MPERAIPKNLDAHAARYWDSLREHRLMLQHCSGCGFVRFPPRSSCPECWSEAFDWREHSGSGRVTSFVWYMKPLDPRFPEVPYNVSLVALDGGPVLVSNVVDVAFGGLRIGDRVKARFSDEKSGFAVLLFEPIGIA